MNFLRENWREAIVSLLVFANILVWVSVYADLPGKELAVYFFDVGQGDAVLIDSPSKKRILIDGGKNKKILSELGYALPFADRKIDVVIGTHPDMDHIGGLPEVVSRYDVGVYIEPGVETDKNIDTELDSRISKERVPVITARRGMVVNLGDGVKLTILFPDQDVTRWNENDASVVARLSYGNRSFLFTGDASIRTENILLRLNSEILDSDVLKVGHHGSRTSTSLTFAEAVSPEYSIISSGKDNTYGHPHQEVTNILEKVGSKIFGTAEHSTMKFVTDGETLGIK